MYVICLFRVSLPGIFHVSSLGYVCMTTARSPGRMLNSMKPFARPRSTPCPGRFLLVASVCVALEGDPWHVACVQGLEGHRP